MLNKSVPLALAVFAVFLMLNEAHAQSGSRNTPSFGGSTSRNIAPSFSGGFSTTPTNLQPAPTATYAPAGGYAPAATPLDTIQIQSSPAPVQSAPVYSSPSYSQPVVSSGCSSCGGATQTYSAPTYSAPTYSAPVYSAPAPVVYSRPVYSQPVYQNYAPVRRGCCGCR